MQTIRFLISDYNATATWMSAQQHCSAAVYHDTNRPLHVLFVANLVLSTSAFVCLHTKRVSTFYNSLYSVQGVVKSRYALQYVQQRKTFASSPTETNLISNRLVGI